MNAARIVLIMAWVSKFTLIWLMILRIVPRNDLFAWGIFLFFWILSFLSSSVISYDNKPKGNIDEE